MNDQRIKKIVVIGPESTGKSTLCKELAEYYHTSWCPEFAREYLLKHGMSYTYDDLLTIAKGQLATEDEYVQSKVLSRESGVCPLIEDTELRTQNLKLLFIDTDMYVLKVWSEFVFGKCHKWILEQIVERKYDLYLLCNTDPPWVKDELREYPDLKKRETLLKIYQDIMVNQSTPWVMIEGNQENRIEIAAKAVDKVIKIQ